MSWFILLKRQTKLYNFMPDYPGKDKVTHFHGSREASRGQLMREGLKPKGPYKKFKGGYTKPIYGDLEDLSGDEKELIFATGKEQELPVEYGRSKKVTQGKIDYDDIFDANGNLLPEPKLPEKKVEVEENMVGIRGDSIEWDRSSSPIYRRGETFYISDKPIDPDNLVFLSIDEWKKYLKR
mgnify:FL=1